MKKDLSKVSRSFHSLQSDYDMSRESRFIRQRTGLAPQGGSADFHTRNEWLYYRDIEKARDVDRNDSLISQAVDRAVSNIVQDGFTLDPQTGDEGLDLELRERWLAFAEDPDACDIQGEFTFHDFEVHALRSMFIDGDIVFLALGDGRIQAIEAHAVRSSQPRDDTVLGVTLDEYRRRLAYWISVDPIDPYRGPQDTNAVPVEVRNAKGFRQVLHVYNPRRMTQTRGVTILAPIFATIGMRDDIDFAMLVQRQVASCFAIIRKQQHIPEVPHAPPSYGDSSTIQVGTDGVRYIENIAPGMEIFGQPGEEITGFTPDIGGGGYETQLRSTLQTIAVNLGLTLGQFLLDASDSNFSGWRGATDEARKGFKLNQRNLRTRLHEPLYRLKVAQWMEEDRALRAIAKQGSISVYSHRWNVPSFAYIDPVKDAQGDAVRISSALTSPRRLHAEKGVDWEDLLGEIVSDNAKAISAAKETAAALNKQGSEGPPVHWRELISLPMPNGVQMTMQDPHAAPGGSSPNATSEGESRPSGEMSGLSRRQWQNNRKAIQDVLDQYVATEISEQRARAELSALGLNSETIESLLLDALEGESATSDGA